MIVAAGGDRGADENSIDKQRGSDFLQPEPGMADGSRDNVEHDRQREAEAQQPAKHHQDQFELVERPPFQMTLPLQHQFVGDGHRQNSQERSDRRNPYARRNLRNYAHAGDRGVGRDPKLRIYLIARIRFLIFSACGPSSLASLSR
jgi:hypothetical protein